MNTTSLSANFTRWGVWLLALCPCLTAWGFHWIPCKPTACAPAEPRPALAFDQYTVNLGPIDPVGMVRGWFRFTNLSEQPITITNLRPSCGCLQPRLEQRDYAPGESGEFAVNVATAGEMPGPREYTIAVDYEDPKPRSVTLTFRLELPPRQLYITPRAVLFYTFGDEPVTKDIVVTDYRLSPATITAVENRVKFITATVAGTETDQDGVQTTTIKVSVAGVAEGTQSTTLKIHTDDPKFPVVNVPIRVQRQPPLSKRPISPTETMP